MRDFLFFTMFDLRRITKTALFSKPYQAKMIWSHVPLYPADKILGLTELFKKDNNFNKVNLGVGAYRDEDGQPFVLPSVKRATDILATKNLDHEYSSIGGIQSFIDKSNEFAYGEGAEAINQSRIAAVQTIGGSGACRLFGDLVAKTLGKHTKIHLPDPTVSKSNQQSYFLIMSINSIYNYILYCIVE